VEKRSIKVHLNCESDRQIEYVSNFVPEVKIKAKSRIIVLCVCVCVGVDRKRAKKSNKRHQLNPNKIHRIEKKTSLEG
jgi:hypothetical protein